MKPVIEVKHLQKSFKGRKVLSDISFTVEKGETFVIIGSSGCGKSTTLKHLIGMLTPDSGEIWIQGENIADVSDQKLKEIRLGFGMLFQSSALFNSMTIGENIALPLREHSNLDPDVIDIVVKMKLEMVGLTGFEDLMPAEISGGMKKRVGLARAIALDPDIVFCDEPGAGLDPITAAVIDQLISDLSRKLGITFVVVTHEMESVFRIADRVMMMYQGQVEEIGTPQSLRQSNNPVVKQFIEGKPEGPIPMQMSGQNYLESLLED